MDERWIARIEREAGVPGLVDVLASRLSGGDLQSLLLAVFERRAAALAPADVLRAYEADRLVRPAPADPASVHGLEERAFQLLPDGWERVELAPVAPLGTSSVLALVAQHRVVATVRRTEVVSDPTNVLALEIASRRRRGRGPDVKLATAQRMLRAKQYPEPLRPHFRVFALCSGGRDRGRFAFETAALREQLTVYLELLEPLEPLRLVLTTVEGGIPADLLEGEVAAPLRTARPLLAVTLESERPAAQGYYDRTCFEIRASSPDGEIALVDGGVTDWTRRLLSDRKERLLISGVGTELLLRAQRSPASSPA